MTTNTRYEKKIMVVTTLLAWFAPVFSTYAQHKDVERPAEWKNLTYGGRFMDRIAPMPYIGKPTDNTWGNPEVQPRDILNGIEYPAWSYWGGNAKLGEDGLYHLYVCRWAEHSPKGHMQWRDSEVVHAVSENSFGPYKVADVIGPGHNPEVFILKDGRKVIYMIDHYYISDRFNGSWEQKKFDFQPRDRKIIERRAIQFDFCTTCSCQACVG